MFRHRRLTKTTRHVERVASDRLRHNLAIPNTTRSIRVSNQRHLTVRHHNFHPTKSTSVRHGIRQYHHLRHVTTNVTRKVIHLRPSDRYRAIGLHEWNNQRRRSARSTIVNTRGNILHRLKPTLTGIDNATTGIKLRTR